MVNLLAPPAIIFCNDDLTAEVRGVIQRQLFITDTMTGAEFDARLAADPSYPAQIHGGGQRILVIRSFLNHEQWDKADLVLFCSHGIAAVERSKVGPPGISFGIDHMYLSQFFFAGQGR